MTDQNASHAGTFSTYDDLPQLPLPSLADTARRYLASVRPLLDANAFNRTEQLMAELTAPGGAGEEIHSKLAEMAQNSDNWMSEWWDTLAYLGYPDPVMINSNFGISCDARTPAEDPATRAAELAARTLDFHVGLLNETIEPDMVGKARQPIDMTLFKKIMASTRVPGFQTDTQVTFSPEEARHIVVMVRGRFYKIDALDASGRALSIAELAAQFQRCIDHARAQADVPPPVAVLTTERRPVWAMERARMKADPINAATLDAIEKAVFIVSFDEQAYDTFNGTARFAINGTGGYTHWMDKVFSYAVDAKGRVSHHGEHSPADGMQFLRIFDYAAERTGEPHGTVRALLTQPQELGWNLSADTLAAIDSALAWFKAKDADLDIEILHFDDFGKDLIKTYGTGPDPMVQIAYQLAYKRLHGRLPKTYESAQTRMFRLGRTETIRSVSIESKSFVEAMDAVTVSDGETANLLRAAFAKHGQLGKEASMGQGVDRHLQGITLMAREMGVAVPALLQEEIWTRGWELSTAQLPMSAGIVNGFGPVCANGYGIGYVIRGGTITCNISSWNSHPMTNSGRFARAIETALRDMRKLLDENPVQQAITSEQRVPA
ncbi:MAG: choline/carnitine O-acyltransferase [Neomegalonema sp.]|nr:choline/carnitine O-acyltransferase [Neomegalonema sp.]